VVLLAVVGLTVAVCAALLVLPVRVDVRLTVGPDAAGPPARARVRWLIFAWETGGADRAGKPGSPDRARQPPARRRGGALAALRTPGFPRRCIRLIRELRHALRPRRVVVRARVGLDDPFETGMLAGAAAAGAVLRTPGAFDVEITPDFSDTALAGRADLSWSLRPAAVLWPIVSFLAAPVVWRAGRAALRERRSRVPTVR
jgi:hypothetical protein